ncbi:MAG: acyclic terpene utilization AtuA family protein [Chloroflexi bacterium]|nr:acyclic terpene utilization AtuA family protein [Chloroflexota bacterium]
MDAFRIVVVKSHIGTAETDRASYLSALKHKPDVVGLQGSSVDFGPYYLGASQCNKSRTKMKEDLELVLPAALSQNAKVILGGMGYAGTRSRVDWFLEILREVSTAHELRFKLAVIYSDVPHDYLRERALRERIQHLELSGNYLTPEDVDASTNIVALMGAEPIVRALSLGAQVVVTGRCCDAAIFAAPAQWAGFDRGLAWHMGTLMECGGLAARPQRGDVALLSTLNQNHFIIESTSSEARCTVESITDHQMYERPSATREHFPGGFFDASSATYEDVGPGQVRVAGAVFHPSHQYEVLINGAGPMGFRSISIGGVRDPLVIPRLGQLEEEAKARVSRDLGEKADYEVRFINYGIDGVLGPYEHRREVLSKEVGVIIDVVASAQELATDVAARLCGILDARTAYPNRVLGQRNFAIPFSPAVQELGVAYRFTIDHLLPLDDPLEIFPITLHKVKGDKWRLLS